MSRIHRRSITLLLLTGCPTQDVALGEDDGGSSMVMVAEVTSGSTTSGSSTDSSAGTPTTSGDASTGSSTDTGESSGGTTAAAEPFCGNGIVEGDELCDDGTFDLDDACDQQCKGRPVPLWTQSWDSGAKNDDYIDSMAVDAEGNIYVAGSVTDADFQADAWIRKLDSTGAELMTLKFAGAAGLDDSARSIAVDADGSIYASGFEFLSKKTFQGWVRKYDKAGKELWAHTRATEVVDGGANINTVVLGDDAVYVVGNENVDDVDTVQFFLQQLGKADGKPKWTTLVPDAVALFKMGLVLLPGGELVVAGGVLDAEEQRQPWVGKFTAAGKAMWSKSDYLAGGGFLMAAAGGPNGELAVTGVGYQFNDTNIWTASLDADGAVIWEDYINADGTDIGYSVAYGSAGELYVGGYVNVSKHMSDCLVRRYTPTGVPYWTDKYNDVVDLYDSVTAVVVTPTVVLAAGQEFVLKHGANQWIRAYAP